MVCVGVLCNEIHNLVFHIQNTNTRYFHSVASESKNYPGALAADFLVKDVNGTIVTVYDGAALYDLFQVGSQDRFVLSFSLSFFLCPVLFLFFFSFPP
jgi:hypothetical protein